METDLSHVKTICSAKYTLNHIAACISFTRAFFMDSFKGIPRHVFAKSDELSNTVVNILPEHKICQRVPRKSSKYYNSLTYTLSCLVRSSDESSDSNSSCDAESIHDEFVKENNLTTSIQGKITLEESSASDSLDKFQMFKQMRKLGLPTSFGPSRNRSWGRKMTNTTVHVRPKEANSIDIDELNLLGFATAIQTASYTRLSRSLTEIPASTVHCCQTLLDDPTYNKPLNLYLLPSVCKVIGLGYSTKQKWSEVQTDLVFWFPAFWVNARKSTIHTRIQDHLNQCRAWRYEAKRRHLMQLSGLPPHTKVSDLTDSGCSEFAEFDKYWAQRYRFFSLFDHGIQINREGLFSVTPEVIAAHHALRIASFLNVPASQCTVVDLFSGVGGNTIQMALRGFKVIAVDICPEMLKLCAANARVYGVEDRITFVQSDVFAWLGSTIASRNSSMLANISAVFASPPWGGPAYTLASSFDLSEMRLGREDIWHLATLMSRITTGPLTFFLPRNANVAQMLHLHRHVFESSARVLRSCVEVELCLIHGKAKGISIYFSNFEDHENCATNDDDDFYDVDECNAESVVWDSTTSQ